MNNPFFRNGKKPLVIAHRGDCTTAPENTRAAFKAAMDVGADGFELDVFLLADNTVVVFHDEDTERLTGAPGDIITMTLAEVRKLSVNDHPIPTLEEILDEFAADTLINVELKAYKPHWDRRSTGTEVAKIIRQCNAEERVIVTSFDPFMLMTLEREYPGLQSGFAYDDAMQIDLDSWFTKINDPEVEKDVQSFATRIGSHFSGFTEAVKGVTDWLTGKRFVTFISEMDTIGDLLGATVVDLEHTLIDNDTIEKFHANEMAIGTYTFFSTDPEYKDILSPEEQEKRILELANLHVDWIETDDPGRVIGVLS